MSGLNDNNAYRDAKKRAEWLNKRINVSSAEFDYIEFQLQEAFKEGVKVANDLHTGEKQCNLPVVSNCPFADVNKKKDTDQAQFDDSFI